MGSDLQGEEVGEGGEVGLGEVGGCDERSEGWGVERTEERSDELEYCSTPSQRGD